MNSPGGPVKTYPNVMRNHWKASSRRMTLSDLCLRSSGSFTKNELEGEVGWWVRVEAEKPVQGFSLQSRGEIKVVWWWSRCLAKFWPAVLGRLPTITITGYTH